MNRFEVVLFATTFLLAPLSGAARLQSGSIVGSIVNSATGQPIEGVQVAIVSGQALTETVIQSMLSEQKPAVQAPQITKTIPALVLQGRTLMPERSAYLVLTDSRGKFTFTGLPLATYSLALRADGYNFQVYGRQPGSLFSLPLNVREGTFDVGVIQMNPEPRISGTILDLDRRPIASIPVYLVRAQPSINIDGKREFRTTGDTMTDSSGRYVFEKIEAGHYYIAAGSFAKPAGVFIAPGRAPVNTPALLPYSFTYHPGVADIGLAAQLNVAAGSKMDVPDMVMPKQELMSIRGRVVDSRTGQPPESVRVVLNAEFPFLRAGRSATEILSSGYNRTTGVFEFSNLIPGNYRVDAVLPRTTNSPQAVGPIGTPADSAFQVLELTNANIENVNLSVPCTGRVKGKVVVADGKPLPVTDRNLPVPLQLGLDPLNTIQPTPRRTSVSTEDGSFEVGSALEGKYRYFIVPLGNYYVSEARLDGSTFTNGVLDISKNTNADLIFVLSPGGQIEGTVVDRKGQPVKQAEGIVLPDPLPEVIPAYQGLFADAEGRFTVNGVPPGRHKIYVWEGVTPAQFFDRELVIRSQGTAVAVRVEKGAAVSVSVPIIIP